MYLPAGVLWYDRQCGLRAQGSLQVVGSLLREVKGGALVQHARGFPVVGPRRRLLAVKGANVASPFCLHPTCPGNVSLHMVGMNQHHSLTSTGPEKPASPTSYNLHNVLPSAQKPSPCIKVQARFGWHGACLAVPNDSHKFAADVVPADPLVAAGLGELDRLCRCLSGGLPATDSTLGLCRFQTDKGTADLLLLSAVHDDCRMEDYDIGQCQGKKLPHGLSG